MRRQKVDAGWRGRRTDRPNSPFALAAKRALEASFGRPAVVARGGGTLPVLRALKDTLGIDTLLVGLEWMDCHVHAPNESFPIKNLARGSRDESAVISRTRGGLKQG